MTNIHDKLRFSGNRELTIRRDNYRCVQCGMSRKAHKNKYGRDITVDHIVGVGVWDSYNTLPNNNLDNLQTLCLRCHGQKDVNKRKRKITDKDVKDIKLALSKGIKGEDLKTRFNVSRATISYIKNNRMKVYNQVQ